MSIYATKRNWKYTLFFFAAFIVVVTLLYSNYVVRKISNEEREKVALWAKAIKQKAELVSFTEHIFEQIALEEKKKVELWSEATRLAIQPDINIDYSFLLKVISDNTTVPVILTKSDGTIISHRNLDENKASDKQWLQSQVVEMNQLRKPIEIPVYGGKVQYLYYKDSKVFTELRAVLGNLVESFISEIAINSARVPVIYYSPMLDSVIAYGNIKPEIITDHVLLKMEILLMQSYNQPIPIKLNNGSENLIFYKDSELLSQLRYYPYIQIFLFIILLLLSYWLFNSFRRAEQNRVWAGMAKETAHQLGTPISSLIAWNELLKSKIDDSIIVEINKDISRLQVVADRFSKIGSEALLKTANINDQIALVADYYRKRSSKNIQINTKYSSDIILAGINETLFEWAIENIVKNAIDSMSGEGVLSLLVEEQETHIYIDIADTGKGIDPKIIKTIFEPGFTTKKRGWGLGLSLTKRIIEEYHKGKVFVKSSQLGEGTVFRIIIPK